MGDFVDLREDAAQCRTLADKILGILHRVVDEHFDAGIRVYF